MEIDFSFGQMLVGQHFSNKIIDNYISVRQHFNMISVFSSYYK